MRDVAIIGAGPAGLVCARVLASLGHDVLILEEHAEIGVPVHCTGLLGLDAFNEFDIPRAAILGTARQAQFVASDGTSVTVDSESVRAAVVDRAQFDQALADSSRSAGAELRVGARVRAVAVGEKSISLSIHGEEASIEARACVVACGASYRFNRQLGFGVPRAFVQSAQLEQAFEGPDHVEVHLGRACASGGFAWIVPFRRGEQPSNRVGLMCESRALPRFRLFAERVRARFLHGQEAWPGPRLKILPLGPVTRTYGTRVLVVGDAAGLVKPTTGGGIYYGLISGRLAAETLDDALRHDALGEERLRDYETRWRSRLGAEIRIGLAFRQLTARMSDPAIDAVIDLARVDGLIPMFRQTADFNWHRRSALALLRHAQFRRIVLSSIWS